MIKTTEKKVIVKGKHQLTPEEKIQNSEELASAMQQVEKLKEKKKEAIAEIDAEIKVQDNQVASCLDKIRTGEEDRDYECRIDRDDEKKEKKFICVDSGKVVKVAPYTASDFQMEIAQNETPKVEEGVK